MKLLPQLSTLAWISLGILPYCCTLKKNPMYNLSSPGFEPRYYWWKAQYVTTELTRTVVNVAKRYREIKGVKDWVSYIFMSLAHILEFLSLFTSMKSCVRVSCTFACRPLLTRAKNSGKAALRLNRYGGIL